MDKDKPMKDVIEPHQKWELDFFRAEDAQGVARLFRSVYGDGYPVKTFTDPKRLIEENAARRTLSSVARTPEGDIIGHTALYGSAPFQGIYESGASVVASNYRGGVIGLRLVEHSVTLVAGKFGVETIFGEPVCNHIVMQKIVAKIGAKTCALEVDLMPAQAYAAEGSASGRVATTLDFIIRDTKAQTVHVPGAYEEAVRFIYGGIPHECRLVSSSEDLPVGMETRIEAQVFDYAKVARFTVHEAGADFASVFHEQEEAAIKKEAIVHQVWLKLSWPWIGRVVDVLRSRGYFIGGVLPRWFDLDGLLMQKILVAPHWDGIQLFTERSHRILGMVKADWSLTRDRA